MITFLKDFRQSEPAIKKGREGGIWGSGGIFHPPLKWAGGWVAEGLPF